VPVPALGEQFSGYARQEHTLRFGMWTFLASELMLFAGLFALYASYRAMFPADFVAAIRHNTIAFGTANTYILLTSSLTAALSVRAARRSDRRGIVVFLSLTIVQGLAFLAVKLIEYGRHVHEGALPGGFYRWAELPTFGANRFYTLYWVMTGLHALHVTAGLIVLGWMSMRAARGAYSARHHTTLEMGTLYWHLVDVVWIFLWPLLYLG
jgi:cytochrome c oxidase subunit 3